ncbi:hypothetical protein ACFWJW_07730 [Streptomyces sp. NPDC127097]
MTNDGPDGPDGHDGPGKTGEFPESLKDPEFQEKFAAEDPPSRL